MHCFDPIIIKKAFDAFVFCRITAQALEQETNLFFDRPKPRPMGVWILRLELSSREDANKDAKCEEQVNDVT